MLLFFEFNQGGVSWFLFLCFEYFRDVIAAVMPVV